jgi:hypothetical protein
VQRLQISLGCGIQVKATASIGRTVTMQALLNPCSNIIYSLLGVFRSYPGVGKGLFRALFRLLGRLGSLLLQVLVRGWWVTGGQRRRPYDRRYRQKTSLPLAVHFRTPRIAHNLRAPSASASCREPAR